MANCSQCGQVLTRHDIEVDRCPQCRNRLEGAGSDRPAAADSATQYDAATIESNSLEEEPAEPRPTGEGVGETLNPDQTLGGAFQQPPTAAEPDAADRSPRPHEDEPKPADRNATVDDVHGGATMDAPRPIAPIGPQDKTVVDQVTAVWASSIQDAGRPEVTLKGKQSAGGGSSSLVVRSRSLRSVESAESADARFDADYELLDVLGTGGMGVVYAARQASVDRTVALKMLKGEHAKGEDQRGKFMSEAVVTGELDHPNIVPIYDLGSNEQGALFYSMKRVEGTPWAELIGQNSLEENLEILMKVADAVAFAHARGVIHRDLKPENVMLGSYGEVLVMDWGLALATDRFSRLHAVSRNYNMGGTPAYMSPEMATGPIERVTPVSDVYLLGAILFEILTGKPPHHGESVMECLTNAAFNVIRKTDKSGELIDIALKAMSKNPDDRYQNVLAFQAAIRGYQSHSESLALASRAEDDLRAAQQSGGYERYSRAVFGLEDALVLWPDNDKARGLLSEAKLAYARAARDNGDYDLAISVLDPDDAQHSQLMPKLQRAASERNQRQQRLRQIKLLAGSLAALLFIVVTVAFFAMRTARNRAVTAEKNAVEQQEIAEQQRQQAESARDREAAARKEAEEAHRREATAREDAEQSRDREASARLAAVEAQEEAVRERDRAQEAEAEAVAARRGEQYEAYVAQIGLAAEKIEENAFATARLLLERCQAEFRHWEWGRLKYLSQRQVGQLGADGPLDDVAYSPEGKLLAAAGWDGKAHLWEAASGREVAAIAHGQYVHAVAFTPDGRQLATGSSDGTVRLHDVATQQRTMTFTGHEEAVLSVDISPDGRWLLTSSYDNTARLWNLETGDPLRVLRGHNWWVWQARFSPDGRRVVTASQDGKAVVWQVETSGHQVRVTKLTEFVEHDGPVYAAAFAPDGGRIASAGHDGSVRIWSPLQIEPISVQARLQGKPDPANPQRRLSGHTAPVRSVSFSPDGSLLVSGSQDNTVRVWDFRSGKLLKAMRGHGEQVRSCRFAPGGDRVASASHDQQVKIWDLDGYQEVRVLRGRVLRGHRDAVLAVGYSPDGKQIVTASRDRTARTWDAATGQPLQTFAEGHAFLATGAVFFPDGRRLLTAGGDSTVRLWNVGTGSELRSMEQTGRNAAVDLAPNGRWIATGSGNRTAKIWDAVTGQMLAQLRPPEADGEASLASVSTVAFSHGSDRLIIGDGRGNAWLWRWNDATGSWQYGAPLPGHNATITAAAFFPGDQRAVTASGDGSISQWDVASAQEVPGLRLQGSGWITSMDLSPDGQLLAFATQQGDVQIWNPHQARPVRDISTGGGQVGCVEFSPDGQRLLFASFDRQVVGIHEVASGARQYTLNLKQRGAPVWTATFSVDGSYVLTVGGDESRLWDPATSQELLSFSPHGTVCSAEFSPDGSRVLTGSWDASAKIWDARSGKSIRKLSGGHREFVNRAAYSPDGKWVLTASDDGKAMLWDAETGKPTGTEFAGHTARVRDAAFSPDGTRVVTASSDKTARIWDVASGRQLQRLEGHRWAVRCAAFSADGRRVVTGSEDTTARIWDAATGQLQQTLNGHSGTVGAAAFSPDGMRVVTGSQDQLAKLWDAHTGREILNIGGHEEEVTSVAFSPSGQDVLTGGRDGVAIVWMASDWRDGSTPSSSPDAPSPTIPRDLFTPGKPPSTAPADTAAAPQPTQEPPASTSVDDLLDPAKPKPPVAETGAMPEPSQPAASPADVTASPKPDDQPSTSASIDDLLGPAKPKPPVAETGAMPEPSQPAASPADVTASPEPDDQPSTSASIDDLLGPTKPKPPAAATDTLPEPAKPEADRSPPSGLDDLFKPPAKPSPEPADKDGGLDDLLAPSPKPGEPPQTDPAMPKPATSDLDDLLGAPKTKADRKDGPALEAPADLPLLDQKDPSLPDDSPSTADKKSAAEKSTGAAPADPQSTNSPSAPKAEPADSSDDMEDMLESLFSKPPAEKPAANKTPSKSSEPPDDLLGPPASSEREAESKPDEPALPPRDGKSEPADDESADTLLDDDLLSPRKKPADKSSEPDPLEGLLLPPRKQDADKGDKKKTDDPLSNLFGPAAGKTPAPDAKRSPDTSGAAGLDDLLSPRGGDKAKSTRNKNETTKSPATDLDELFKTPAKK